MIHYSPVDQDVFGRRIQMRPKTCFTMTKLGAPVSQELVRIRRNVERHLRKRSIKSIDAGSVITGKDFLLKIWQMIVSVPLGIGIITDDMTAGTMSNVFYEIGLLHALGKESLVIKSQN